MRIRNFKTKFLSAFVALLILLPLTPVGNIVANSFESATEVMAFENTSTEIVDITEENLSSEKFVVQEDISKRTEFAKHFYCTDGTFVAIYYPEAVHYEKDGIWYDVDNTLRFDSKIGRYKTANEDFAVSFASSGNGSLVALEKDGNTISWDLYFSKVNESKISTTSNLLSSEESSLKALSTNTFSVKLQDSASAVDFEGITPENLQSTKLPNLKGKIEYNNILEENSVIDIHYTVEQNKIKEDIILREKTDVTSYVISMNIGSLSAVLNGDNSVSLVDNSGKTVYTVEAPYMYDAMDDLSYDIEVKVTQKGSSCLISYTPSNEWINSENRVIP